MFEIQKIYVFFHINTDIRATVVLSTYYRRIVRHLETEARKETAGILK